MHSGCRTRCVD